jgi:hypothetical protein
MPTHPAFVATLLLLHVQRAYGFSMLLQSVCGSSIYTHTLALFSYDMGPLDATFVSSLRAGLHSISVQHPACSATYGLPPATATVICVCTCSPVLLCFGLRRVGLSDDLASYRRELLWATANRRSRMVIYVCACGLGCLSLYYIIPFPRQHSFPPASVRCRPTQLLFPRS